MKQKLLEFIRNHIVVILMLGILLFAAGVFSFNAYLEQRKLDKTVTTQQTEVNKAVQESRNESGAAANYSIERRAEDAIRERVIKPKLDDARRRSANSKFDLENAQKQYEIKKFDTENLTSDASDNCRNLAALFPDVRFESCQPN